MHVKTLHTISDAEDFNPQSANCQSLLFLQFRNSDPEAYKQIFRNYYPKMCFYAGQLLSGDAAVEEIASDTLKKVWMKRRSFDNEAKMVSFMFTATRNACLNEIRSNSRRGKMIAGLKHLAQNDAEPGGIDLEKNKSQLIERLYHQLELLPQDVQQILKLSIVQKWRVCQIAEKLHLNENQVRLKKSRALVDLRHILQLVQGAGLVLISIGILSH